MQKIAVLTSGGDAPGMNYAVVSIARSASHYDMSLIGINRGYYGLIHKNKRLLDALFERAREVVSGNREDTLTLEAMHRTVHGEIQGAFPAFRALLAKYRKDLCLFDDFNTFLSEYPDFRKDFINFDIDIVLDIADRPGTYLRTARCDDFKNPVNALISILTLVANGIEGVIVIGGDGSFKGAMSMCDLGMPCIGIPCTIDNDLNYTEMTLGFDTAVNVCLEAIRNIRATSRSHDRPHVVEVMGRDCGDIALRAATASGAEIVLVPEQPWSIEDVAFRLQRQINMGNTRATIVVAEGAYASMAPFDIYGFLMQRGKVCYPGETISALRLADILKYMCTDSEGKPVEPRSTVLGYTQRGAPPSAYDAAFAFEAGNIAVKLLREGNGNQVIGIQKGHIFTMSIQQALRLQQRGGNFFNYQLLKLINSITEPHGENEERFI